MPFASTATSQYASSSSTLATGHTPHPIPNRPQSQQTMTGEYGYAQRARGSGAGPWNSAQAYTSSATPNGFLTRENSSPDHHSPASPPASSANSQGMQQTLTSAGSVNMQRNGSSGATSENGRSGREFDRDRERPERADRERDRSAAQEDEVISTIFVVGFPDDMQEREFQNIFTFSTGFEAATLKFPSGSSVTPRNAGPMTSTGGDNNGNENEQQHAQNQALEEALAALQMGSGHAPGTHPTSSSSSTAAPTPVMPQQPSHPSRRQTIGFARFRSRQDALAARDYLQGRKIDSLTGATLKAEMAKKNLHTKRGPAGEELVGMLLRSGRLNMNGLGALGGLAGLGALLQQVQAQAQSNQIVPMPTNPGIQPIMNGNSKFVSPSWDPSWPRQPGRLPTALAASLPQAPVQFAAPEDKAGLHRSMPTFASQTYAAVSQPAPFPPQQQQQQLPVHQQPIQQAATPSQQQQQLSPSLQMKSPITRPKDSKALLALAEEADELEGWSVSGINNLGLMEYSQTGLAQIRPSHDFDQSSVGSFGSSPPKDASSESDAGRTTSAAHSLNPADQNPPINTLYIGNLPATTPLSHPPSFLEDNLRALFQRSPGFKRMSFRQKLNGPMCFVEFEDVPMATNAIKELYGHTLGGLVKGGIRLSYSKNSLGQRGNGFPASMSSSSGMYSGMAHNVAMAGMSQSPPVSGGSTQASFAHQQQQPSFGRQNSDTPLSPNAQPFASILPMPASPRSRYFSGEVQPGSYSSQTQQFSPVLSPVRPQPQSLSWLSSSTQSNPGSSAGPAPLYGNGSFDPFARAAGAGPPGGGWGTVGQAAHSK